MASPICAAFPGTQLHVTPAPCGSSWRAHTSEGERLPRGGLRCKPQNLASFRAFRTCSRSNSLPHCTAQANIQRGAAFARRSSGGSNSKCHLSHGLLSAESVSIAKASARAASLEDAADSPVYLGYDFGTSGARIVAIDAECLQLFEAKRAYKNSTGTEDAADDWRQVLFALLEAVPAGIRRRTAGISLDGTSATAFIVDRRTGAPLCAPMMYNESFTDSLPAVRAIAPPNHTVTTGTSTLCKLVSWWARHVDTDGTLLPSVGLRVPGPERAEPRLSPAKRAKGADSVALCHQADWLLHHFLGWGGQEEITTDYNNALKVGYDPEAEAYPDWLRAQPYAAILPRVVGPGDCLGVVSSAVAASSGLPRDCRVLAGTTDSIAAFLAARVSQPGEAVTSLGSTLAVKLLSTTRVDDARYGIYSHRMRDTWLVGGASNTGGAVLRSFFTDSQLASLSQIIDPLTSTTMDYYPLLKPGERFPVSDPDLEPRLSPRPPSDAEFLKGLLESMARIEAQGYRLLQELGSSPLTFIATAGGGSQNATWTAIRERVIGVPVAASEHADAAFGAALLARDGCDALLVQSRKS